MVEKFNENFESGNELIHLSDEDLAVKKQEAIAAEDYDLAKKIKAEQDRRKSESDCIEIQDDKRNDNMNQKILESVKSISTDNGDAVDDEDGIDTHKEMIDISEEEFLVVSNLVKSSFKIMDMYMDDNSVYENDLDIYELASFDDDHLNQYFKDHDIKSKGDFIEYVLDLCNGYCEQYDHLIHSTGSSRGDLDSLRDFKNNLEDFNDYVLCNISGDNYDEYKLDSLYDKFDNLKEYANKKYRILQDYLDL